MKAFRAEMEHAWQTHARPLLVADPDAAQALRGALDAVTAAAAAAPLSFIFEWQQGQQALEAARAQPRNPIAARLVWSDDDEDDDTDLLHDARRGARRRLR